MVYRLIHRLYSIFSSENISGSRKVRIIMGLSVSLFR